MTDDLVVFHGGAMDGHTMQVPSGPGGPDNLLHLPPTDPVPALSDFDGPTCPRAHSLTYRRRLAMSDKDHAWHYDLEQS